MTRYTRIASIAAAATLAVSLSPVSASAAPCASRAQVHQQIADLRTDMRDAVKSEHTRSAVADAVHEVLDAWRGADATTPAERESLGQQISATVKALHDARAKVEKKAFGLEVKALREQREHGAMTADERTALKITFAALKDAVVAKADSKAGRSELSTDFRALREAIVC